MRRGLLIVILAIENAWITEYRGEAPAALWTRIKKAMQQADLYAKYLAIVQSSGTGKSRMIEELSKKHLVIPVNLRDSLESGLYFFSHAAGWQWLKSFRISSSRQETIRISFRDDQRNRGPRPCCSFSKGSLRGDFKSYY